MADRLKEVGQELAFHFATDPILYLTMGELTDAELAADLSTNGEIVLVRKRLGEIASPQLKAKLKL